MASAIRNLIQNKIIRPPKFLEDGMHYEVVMGSIAYGCSNEGSSDFDVYGFAVPPIEYIFPHRGGYIHNFGIKEKAPVFNQYQEHHVNHNSKEYDFAIYGIVKYFQLCMEGNPNMIDSLFVPDRCVLHITEVGHHIRDNRKDFLHKGIKHKFAGFCHSSFAKLMGKKVAAWVLLCKNYGKDIHSDPNKWDIANTATGIKAITLYKQVTQSGKLSYRAEGILKHGYDLKFGYHAIRALMEAEQILEHGDLYLERDREIYKSIRRGEWDLDRITHVYTERMMGLENLYINSTLRHAPDESRIKEILMQCLEMVYGSISKAITNVSSETRAIKQIEDILKGLK